MATISDIDRLTAMSKEHTKSIDLLVQSIEASDHAMEQVATALQTLTEEMAVQGLVIIQLKAALNDQANLIKSEADVSMYADTVLEAQIKTSNTRRRINRSISVKGIVQYEGTVEGNGLTHEEFMVEQAKIDLEIDRLQPQYEEFVKPLPKE